MEILDDRSVIYQLEVYKKWYEEQQEEIERLNNIIDELEKYLKNRIDELQEQERIYQLNNGVPIYELFSFLGTIIRLKELKGSDKDEKNINE